MKKKRSHDTMIRSEFKKESNGHTLYNLIKLVKEKDGEEKDDRSRVVRCGVMILYVPFINHSLEIIVSRHHNSVTSSSTLPIPHPHPSS